MIPTTRSVRKSTETIATLRKHLARAAATDSLRARGVVSPQDAIDRVHILSTQLDLCNLVSIQDAADTLVNGTLTLDGTGDVRIPRLDAVIFNAGLGGWDGVNWVKFCLNICTHGWVDATTRPKFKNSTPGHLVDPLPSSKGKTEGESSPTLGLVFCGNVFGHYMFAHNLLPLLDRKRGDGEDIAPGRIIWQSSVDPALHHFSLEDFQGTKTNTAYESSKILTDILCLTAELPSVKPYSAPYLSSSVPPPPTVTSPKLYVAHPGVVATTLFPLHWMMMAGYQLGLLIARWLGSPWHPVWPYPAAVATVWLALSTQETLDRENATRVKWGSATDIRGNALVKKTEVDGWGWEGKVETLDDNDGAVGVMRKKIGRRLNQTLATEETLAQFEEVGKECWKEMERLRLEWEARL